MSFNDLQLAEPIVRAVDGEGYTTPTPIQTQAIPPALAGQDVLGCAQTGTGKTCAFALPILHRLAGVSEHHGKRARRGARKGGRGQSPRALILCPTRELASQIFDSFVTYGRHLALRHTVVFGGVSQFRQVRDLRAGVDVLVATPGRLLDLINQGHIDLKFIETLVLDEADRMLDMGFIPDIRKVVKMIPAERQTLFFSATLSREIRGLADALLRDPVLVETTPEVTTVESIAQSVYMVERRNKPLLLQHLLRQEHVRRTLVFTRTKYGADKLTKHLVQSGVNADSIHGDKSQNARTRAMNGFKRGATCVLVATDVASRGIDVDEITHVVNFDMPIDAETYVHRVGRTARAGASGIAVSFCDRDEIGILRAVERRTNIQIDVAEDAPELAFKAAPRSDSRDRDRSGDRSRDRTGKPRKPRTTGSNWGSKRSGRPAKSTSDARPRKPRANGENGESRDAGQSGSNGRIRKPKANGGGWKPKSNGRSRSTGSSERNATTTRNKTSGGHSRNAKPGGHRGAKKSARRQG